MDYLDDEAARIEYQRARYQLVTDDADELAEEFLRQKDPDGAEHYGPPDTSLNPLSSATRQLTTPGLYGVLPTAEVVGDQSVLQALAAAGYWQRGRWAQFLTVGVGIAFRRLTAITVQADGARVARIVDVVVPAHEVVHVRCAPEDPLEIRELWHRVVRLRRKGDRDVRVETIERWALEVGPDGRRTGSWSIHEPTARSTQRGSPGRDVSAEFLERSDGSRGVLVGDQFPCRDAGGDAVLPWVVCRAEDTGEFWPAHWRRAMHRGSLQAIAHWTYVGWTAFFATGEAHVLVGVAPDVFPTKQKVVGGDPADPRARTTATMRIHPGTIVAVPNPEGNPITPIKIGPGANLPNLLSMATSYNTLTHVADGLNPSDATRQHANPTSGTALEISAKSRREFSDAVRPLAHAADLLAVRIVTYLLRTLGAEVELPDPSTYTLRYHTIPLTPAEQEEIRASIEWEQDRGHLSIVGAHRRLHPAKDEEQARADLVAVAVEDARLRVAIEEGLRAAGLPGATTASPFADVGLPSLVESGIIGTAAARQLLGLDETAAPEPPGVAPDDGPDANPNDNEPDPADPGETKGGE